MKKAFVLSLGILLYCGSPAIIPVMADEAAAVLQEAAIRSQESDTDSQPAVTAGQETDTASQPAVTAGQEMDTDNQPAVDVEQRDWQAKPVFPDWKGYTDDTLAMNSMCSFTAYHDQGTLYVQVSDEVESFKLYVNANAVDTSQMTAGGLYPVDISSFARNGENTLQVSNIQPAGLKEAVTVYIPYPEVLEGTPEEEGIHPEALSLIEDLIETDIENGFTSAQLSVIRNGRLVYENAWGRTNSYLPDGTPCTDSAPVTTDTLFDLASVTKMFSVNYALQKLMTDGKVDLNAKISDFLGEEFVTETIQTEIDSTGEPKDPAALPELETIKNGKAN